MASGPPKPRTSKQTAATRVAHASQRAVRAKTATKHSQPDAVALLRGDHKTIRQLLSDLKSAEKPTERQRLLAKVKAELTAHTKIEEEIFYPAFQAAGRAKKDQQLFHEATAEHHAAELILQEVESADDRGPEFAGRAKVLKELVEHHAAEEEADMFPRARKLLDQDELRTLGARMAERKLELLAESSGQGGTLRKIANFVTASLSGPAKPASKARARKTQRG